MAGRKRSIAKQNNVACASFIMVHCHSILFSYPPSSAICLPHRAKSMNVCLSNKHVKS